MTAGLRIRRGFADLLHGQVHYRSAGDAGEPVLLLHAGPGSSRQLVGLIRDLAEESRVFAPDMPGNGDSEPLGIEAVDIAALAAATLAFLDAMGLGRVAVYGSHTGAAVAAELAILAPERVSRIVLDGVALFEGEELGEVLDRYARPFEPDLEGAYLVRLFQFCRDQYLFFPWYRRTRAARRDGGIGRAEDLHAWVTEVMKGATTYHVNYHAAFRWRADERLALVPCPVLMLAVEDDPLASTSKALAPLVPLGRFLPLPRYDDPGFAAARRTAITTFLAEET